MTFDPPLPEIHDHLLTIATHSSRKKAVVGYLYSWKQQASHIVFDPPSKFPHFNAATAAAAALAVV